MTEPKSVKQAHWRIMQNRRRQRQRERECERKSEQTSMKYRRKFTQIHQNYGEMRAAVPGFTRARSLPPRHVIQHKHTHGVDNGHWTVT